MLSAQAQAHTLANLLSLVGAVSRRRPRAAEDLLGYVAAFLRTQLTPIRPMIRFADELCLTMSLVGVERARLGSRLRTEWRCDAETHPMMVPPLLLQPLIENAIRHGIARRPAGGCLRVSARVRGAALVIAVSDDGPGMARPAPGSAGWGLVGLRLRLEALWGASARLRILSVPDRGTLAAISLPVVPDAGGDPAVVGSVDGGGGGAP
jgi:LytS/YehU family sensor histidine kinase